MKINKIKLKISGGVNIEIIIKKKKIKQLSILN